MKERFRACGIIAEFNPFHSGHEYIIREAKKRTDAVVAVMSGNFTQRCEPAVCEKQARAKAAIAGGCDLVIGLPARYALGSAEKFAYGAISSLMNIGCVDSLCFGSECGNIDFLKKAAESVDSITPQEYKAALSGGKPFAAARQELSGCEIKKPNDILAVEYLRAIKRLDAPFEPFTVKRTDGYLESGSSLRQAIENHDLSSLPEYSQKILEEEISAGRAPSSVRNIERIILAFVRNARGDDFEGIYGINPSEGMAERILASSSETSLEDFYAAVKTKRFALSAVRRAVISAYLRIKNEPLSPVPFVHVLAFSDKGKELLRSVPGNIPVGYNLAKIKDRYPEYADEERRVTDLFMLSTPRIGKGTTEFTRKFT